MLYIQTMQGAPYIAIAAELETHACEELNHALFITKQIDHFNGTPITAPMEVKLSDQPEEMLRFDLENERETIVEYRNRIRQADEIG